MEVQYYLLNMANIKLKNIVTEELKKQKQLKYNELLERSLVATDEFLHNLKSRMRDLGHKDV